MGNVLEKKAFWIVLVIAFVLLIGGLIFGLVMTIKYGEPGEQKEEKQNCFARICKLQKLIKEEASLSNLCKSFKYLL